MSRERYRWNKVTRKLVMIEKDGEPVKLSPEDAEVFVQERKSGMQIIPDFTDPVYSHADGKRYTSKREWRAHLRRHGLVEFGNEKVANRPPELPPVAADVAAAWDKLS